MAAYKPKMVIPYYGLFIIAVLMIFMYGKYRCEHKKFKDPLETQLFLGLDGWAMTHVSFFIIVGYFYPETFYLSMVMGAGWELFEHISGKNRPGWLGGYGGCNNLATDKETGNWFYGKWTDLVCNAIGFAIGWGLGPQG